MHIERLWRNVPARLAKEHDGSARTSSLKELFPISRYSGLAGSIDWLGAAGLIVKARIVSSGQLPFRACRGKQFKLYVFDVGLLGALSGLPQSLSWV